MKVRDRMTPEVTTLTPENTLLKAMSLVPQKGVRHLPVVQGRQVVGMVTERDIRRVSAITLPGPRPKRGARFSGSSPPISRS